MAVVSVRVTVGEIVGLVVGGIVGEVVGRTVDGNRGAMLLARLIRRCVVAGPGTVLVTRCGGVGARSGTFGLSVARCFVGAASAASAA